MSETLETLGAPSNLARVPPARIAVLYAHTGEKERAFEWLEKAYDEQSPGMPYLGALPPGLRGLQADPRSRARHRSKQS